MPFIVILIIIIIIWTVHSNRKKVNYSGYRAGYSVGSKGLTLPNDLEILSLGGYKDIDGTSKSFIKGFKYGFRDGQRSINE
jgi:hypothetical protein